VIRFSEIQYVGLLTQPPLSLT